MDIKNSPLLQSMPHKKLNNYLITNRKRAGLFQRELAFLLGCKGAAKVSRYERLARQPTLETALAYEALFGTPVRELFPGIYSEVEREVVKRAKELTFNLQSGKSDLMTVRKLEFLRMVVAAPDIIAENE